MSTWRPFPGLFPVDTRQLLSILLPKLLVDAEQLCAAGGAYPVVNRKFMARHQENVQVRTVSEKPGVYQLQLRVGEDDWSPWMDPAALQMWLILEYPTMFAVAV